MSDNDSHAIVPQPGPQTQFLKAEEHLVLYGGGGGGGKVQPDEAEVKTPTGHVLMKHIEVGDTVLDPHGGTQTVTGKYPHTDWDFYLIRFSDGSVCEAGMEHLWEVRKDGGEDTVVTTETLMEWLKGGHDVFLPVTEAVQYGHGVYQTSPSPISPYRAGVFFGDTNLTGNSGVDTASLTPFLFSSVEDRTEALKGIMDTSGYVREDGGLTCCVGGDVVADIVTHLVQSLGGLATPFEDDNTGMLSLSLKLPGHIEPFKKRNAQFFYSPDDSPLRRRVVSVEYSRNCDGACISVSGDSNLYLTDDFIVTHNTWGILADNLQFVSDPDYFSVFFRKTTTELETNLWPEAKKMYRPYLEYQSGPKKGKYIGLAGIREDNKTITFPSGAKSRFSYLELDKHADS